MFDLTLETAKVVDINDPKKEGKIQINIESKFKNFKKDLLPWAIPLISNTSDSTMSFNPPKVGSQVWVLRDEYWKRFYYISNRYFYNLFDFSKISGLLDKCDKINKEYKNIRFNYYEDGTLLFHNNQDGSSGIVNSQETVIYIDSEGNFVRNINKDEIIEIKGDRKETINGKSTIKITKDYECTINGKDIRNITSNMDYNVNGNITLKSKTLGQVEIGNTIATVGSLLSDLCTALTSLTTVGNQNTQSASPAFTAQISSLLAKIKLTLK